MSKFELIWITSKYFHNFFWRDSNNGSEQIWIGVIPISKASKIPAVSPIKIEILKVDDEAQRIQVNRLKKLKKNRDNDKVAKALEALRKTYENNDKNCMYDTLNAVQSYATLQEIVDVGREVFGEWKEPQIF